MSVFDRLRDSQIMPEPKDYADWRQRLNEITAEVEQGLYQELWSLPNGSVYRVTGRPHRMVRLRYCSNIYLQK